MARYQGTGYVRSAMPREVAATLIGDLAFARPVGRMGRSQSQRRSEAGGQLEGNHLQSVERSE